SITSFGSSSVWMCRSVLIQSALPILLILILILDSFRSRARARASGLPNGTCQVTGSTANSRASDAQELGWWNGRHVRLRGVCRKACGFKSRPEHHYFIGLSVRGLFVRIRASRLQPVLGVSS